MTNTALYNEATMAIEKLIAKAKHEKSTSLKSYIAAMFSADDNSPIRFTGQIGMLQLDMDR